MDDRDASAIGRVVRRCPLHREHQLDRLLEAVVHPQPRVGEDNVLGAAAYAESLENSVAIDLYARFSPSLFPHQHSFRYVRREIHGAVSVPAVSFRVEEYAVAGGGLEGEHYSELALLQPSVLRQAVHQQRVPHEARHLHVGLLLALAPAILQGAAATGACWANGT